MPTPPTMPYQDRVLRMRTKHDQLLRFLASGEVYTVPDVAAELMGVSRPVALKTCQRLEVDGALKSEAHLVQGRRRVIFGITPHGMVLAGEFGHSGAFELGRTNPSWIPHRLDTQRMRLRALAAGWINWQPERALIGKGWGKVPDALATDVNGHCVAIEIERHAKTQKRYTEIILAYLLQMKAGKLQRVEYVTPGIAHLIAGCFTKIERVKYQGEWIYLTEKHRERFRFFNFENWPAGSNQREDGQ